MEVNMGEIELSGVTQTRPQKRCQTCRDYLEGCYRNALVLVSSRYTKLQVPSLL